MAPIQCQWCRGLHTVHQVRLQQFRKSVLRQSTITDSIGQTVPAIAWVQLSFSAGSVCLDKVIRYH